MVKITSFIIKPLLLVLTAGMIVFGFAIQNMAVPNMENSLIFFIFAAVAIILYIVIHMLVTKLTQLNDVQ